MSAARRLRSKPVDVVGVDDRLPSSARPGERSTPARHLVISGSDELLGHRVHAVVGELTEAGEPVGKATRLGA
jgi:hypothetical protein